MQQKTKEKKLTCFSLKLDELCNECVLTSLVSIEERPRENDIVTLERARFK